MAKKNDFLHLCLFLRVSSKQLGVATNNFLGSESQVCFTCFLKTLIGINLCLGSRWWMVLNKGRVLLSNWFLLREMDQSLYEDFLCQKIKTFTELAYFADSVIESRCPSVCMSVCLFVCAIECRSSSVGQSLPPSGPTKGVRPKLRSQRSQLPTLQIYLKVDL